MEPTQKATHQARTLTVRASAPTRVDLAGGTLDLWPVAHILRAQFGHALPVARTINFGLEKRTSCELELGRSSRRGDRELTLTLSDETHTQTFAYPREAQAIRYGFPLLSSVVEEFAASVSHSGWTDVRVATCSDVPRGSGLGGSSSLFVTLLCAFETAITGEFPRDLFATCQRACNLEAGLLGGLAGTQDHLGAAFGGLSVFTYRADGVERGALPDSGLQWLKDNCVLAMAPEIHHSGNANGQVMRGFLERDGRAVEMFRAVAENAAAVEEALRNEDFQSTPGLLAKDWNLRRSAFPALTTPSLEHIRELALSAGARAVKVCGAAAGGMALVVHAGQAEGERKIRSALENHGYMALDVQPAPKGVTCESAA